MVRIEGIYEGGLRCGANHGPSGRGIATDAPVDNHGKGESFSPTDLCATAMMTCMMTIMGIRARAKEISLRGTVMTVDKHMTQTAPRRISKLVLSFELPSSVELAVREELEAAARSCPVALSLNPEIEVEASFQWTR